MFSICSLFSSFFSIGPTSEPMVQIRDTAPKMDLFWIFVFESFSTVPQWSWSFLILYKGSQAYTLPNDVSHFQFQATTAEFGASKVKTVQIWQLSSKLCTWQDCEWYRWCMGMNYYGLIETHGKISIFDIIGQEFLRFQSLTGHFVQTKCTFQSEKNQKYIILLYKTRFTSNVSTELQRQTTLCKIIMYPL